jgi:hypothetical protein
MKSYLLISLGVALLTLIMASGCAKNHEEPMGASVRQAVAAQTLNPDAGGVEPVEGMDGRTAVRVAESHESSFGGEKKGSGIMEQMLDMLGGQEK